MSAEEANPAYATGGVSGIEPFPFETLLANESNSVILSGTSKKIRMDICIARFPCFEAIKERAIQAIRTSGRSVPADSRICVIRQQGLLKHNLRAGQAKSALASHSPSSVIHSLLRDFISVTDAWSMHIL